MNKSSLTSTQFNALAASFGFKGELESLTLHKRGHIHDTYVSAWILGGRRIRYVHQRINEGVFRDVPGLLRNIEIVTTHLPARIAALKVSSEDVTLKLVPTRDGSLFYKDPDGNWWRTYDFVEKTFSYDVCTSVEQAEEASAILGRFQYYVLDLDPKRLIETIPHFLSSPRRFAALQDACKSDIASRVSSAASEIEFANKRSNLVSIIELSMSDGSIPVRVVHGDMKLNNALFSETSRRAICLVDLDTCMPGYSLFDFGDLARNTAIPTAEDEQDFTKVQVDLEFFRGIVRGYLRCAANFLTIKERELMPVAPRLLALTLGTRFLTDYLSGDTYFKIDRPLHNLERARTQFKVVERMEAAESKMKQIVNEEFPR